MFETSRFTRRAVRWHLGCMAPALATLLLSSCASQDPIDVPVATSTVAAIPAAEGDLATPISPLTTPTDAVFVTIELEVDPSKLAEFLAVMAAAAPDTRAFAGCRLFDIYTDDNTPGRVLFYEIWDSKAQQQTYLAWRAETKFRDQIAPFLTGGSPPSYYSKFPG